MGQLGKPTILGGFPIYQLPFFLMKNPTLGPPPAPSVSSKLPKAPGGGRRAVRLRPPVEIYMISQGIWSRYVNTKNTNV